MPKTYVKNAFLPAAQENLGKFHNYIHYYLYKAYLMKSMKLIYRLNMELNLQSLFGLHVHSCTHWLRPRTPLPPTPRVWGQLLVSQDRRHLFVTPLYTIYFSCRCCWRSCLSAITFLILSKSGSEFETFCRIWIRHFPCLGSGSGFAYSFMKELSRTHLGPVCFKWPDPPLAQNEIQSPNL